MKALIFAAGRGKRMMPLTAERPKPLIEVAGKPLLEYTLEALPDEITEVVMVVGYKGEMIQEYFGSEWHGKSITYVEQKEQLGTGDALWACKSFIAPEERFLIIYADDVYDRGSFERLLEHPRAILGAEVDHPERFGIIITDSSGRVVDIEEKPEHPKSNLAWIGTALIDGAVFEYPPSINEKYGEHFIQSMILPYMHKFDVFVEKATNWIPVGYPEDIPKAEAALKARSS